MNKFCNRCGIWFLKDLIFCPHCGKFLQSTKSVKKLRTNKTDLAIKTKSLKIDKNGQIKLF